MVESTTRDARAVEIVTGEDPRGASTQKDRACSSARFGILFAQSYLGPSDYLAGAGTLVDGGGGVFVPAGLLSVDELSQPVKNIPLMAAISTTRVNFLFIMSKT